MQVILFWNLTKQPINLKPRITLLMIYLSTLATVLVQGAERTLGGEKGLSILGLVPMVVGTGSRIPQIIANFKQGHTGTLSVITWGLSMAGNLLRVVTTLALVDDVVTLFGHVAALATNVLLVGQILFFWNKTQKVLEAEQAMKKK